MKLAEKIQDLRKKNGLSQEQLADQLGVSRQAISKWESEQSTPDIDKIVLLSEFFQVSTDYLLKEEKDMLSKSEEIKKEDYTIAVNVKMSKKAFSYLLLGILFLMTFLFFLLFIRTLDIYMLIVTFPFLFVSMFMFACFGYEYGMGKIISKIQVTLDFIKTYIKDNEIAKGTLVAVIILFGFVILMLIGLH